MPARKHAALLQRHSTKAEINERLAAEAALISDHELPENEPAALKKNAVAAATWRRLMREYNRLEAKLVAPLDRDLLIDYCLIMAQIEELDTMRTSAKVMWETLSEIFRKLHESQDGDPGLAMKLADKVIAAYDRVLKLDARVDAKRKLAFQYRQSLFMTPRSRTGVKPDEDKDKGRPEDPFEKLLNDSVNEFSSNPGGSGDAA